MHIYTLTELASHACTTQKTATCIRQIEETGTDNSRRSSYLHVVYD